MSTHRPDRSARVWNSLRTGSSVFSCRSSHDDFNHVIRLPFTRRGREVQSLHRPPEMDLVSLASRRVTKPASWGHRKCRHRHRRPRWGPRRPYFFWARLGGTRPCDAPLSDAPVSPLRTLAAGCPPAAYRPPAPSTTPAGSDLAIKLPALMASQDISYKVRATTAHGPASEGQ